MNSILLILAGAVGGVLLYMLIRRIFKKKPTYEPTGRLGYCRAQNGGYHYVLIVEEIDRIENHTLDKRRIKIKVLEVDIDLDCNKTEAQCLKDWGRPSWVLETEFIWDEKTAAEIRQEKIDSIVGNEDNNS